MASAPQIPAVQLPFAGYKWRWMEFTPVESFNRLDILLGITRAIRDFEGQPASTTAFNSRLQKVQADLLPGGSPSLTTNDPQRNVLRRQGRYWRGLGLLAPPSGTGMQLTALGRDFADGKLTRDDFVRIVIKQHSLPNPAIDSSATIQAWQSAHLHIRPLATIIAVMAELAKQAGPSAAYITTEQLHRVIVPLYVASPSPSALASAVLQFRQNEAPFGGLPECAPDSNDRRMLREHLLFLQNGGLLSVDAVGDTYLDRYRLLAQDAALAAAALQSQQASSATDVEDVATDTIVSVQRARKTVDVLDRPGQAKFRKDVMANCGGRCLLTGEALPDVLVACHVHEVTDGGSDHVSNGLLLRSDVHTLFDLNKLRIAADGAITCSPDVAASPGYAALPAQVTMPANLNTSALRKRYEYGSVT
jgi:hypothetical protein